MVHMGLFIVLRLYSADPEKEKLPIVGNSSLITNLWTEFWFSRAPFEIFSKRCFRGSILPFWSDKIDFSHIFDSFLKILNADSWSVKNFSKELINNFWVVNAVTFYRRTGNKLRMAQKIVASLFVKTLYFLLIFVEVFYVKNGWQRTQYNKTHPVDFSHIFDSFLKILNADSWSVKNFGIVPINPIFS